MKMKRCLIELVSIYMILMPGKKSYFDSVSCWEYNFTTCDDGDDDGSIEIGHMK